MPLNDSRPISDLSGDVHYDILPEDFSPIFHSMADFLDAAIADARGLDRNRYLPCSEEWHTTLPDQPCLVCLAGAFIAGTLEFLPSFDIRPSMFTHQMHDKLMVLDAMRCGEWVYAFIKFYSDRPSLATELALSDLPEPLHDDFDSWEEFDLHLASLEAIIPDLREIEKLD